MSYLLTIIVPVFNEEESLPALVEAMLEFLSLSPMKSKILLINDGSTDNSLALMKAVVQEDFRFAVISLRKNQGLSTALKVGFDACNTKYTGYMDADLQASPMDFLLYMEHLPRYNMINGIRTHRNDGFIKKLSSKIANGVRRMLINDGIADTCCPLKILETSYAQSIPFFKGMHRFIPALVQLQGGTVKQVPVSHYSRVAGTAKYHLFNRLVGPFYDTLAFVWMSKRWISYSIEDEDEFAQIQIMEGAPVVE